MTLCLGKTAARPGAIKLEFGAYFSAPNLPIPPMVFGKPWLVTEWGVLGNDLEADCVQAGACHETMLFTAESKGIPAPFTLANVNADYLAMNPGDTTFSNGTDMQVAASYRQKIGMIDATGVRHKIDAYVNLAVGDLTQIALATYLMGAVGIGVQLPTSVYAQFDNAEPFSVVPGSTIDGGHYVPCVGRNSRGNYLVVTWGRLQAVTPEWLQAYMDEGVAVVSLDRLRNGISPQGFNEAALLADLSTLQSKGSLS